MCVTLTVIHLKPIWPYMHINVTEVLRTYNTCSHGDGDHHSVLRTVQTFKGIILQTRVDCNQVSTTDRITLKVVLLKSQSLVPSFSRRNVSSKEMSPSSDGFSCDEYKIKIILWDGMAKIMREFQVSSGAFCNSRK